MSLRKRGNQWHYRFKYAGREYSKSTGLEDTERNRTAAQRIEARDYMTISQGGQIRTDQISFSDAAEEFLKWVEGHHAKKPRTTKRIRASFSSLRELFRDRRVSGITSGDILDYAAWRKMRHGVKSITVRHDLHALSKFYRYAIKHNWATLNPVRSEDIPSGNAGRMHVFSDDEQRAYLAGAARFPKLLDLCLLILLQGCRPEELLSLRVEDVDLAAGYMRIVDSKSEAGKRKLKLRPESISILLNRLTASEWVFTGERNKQAKLNLITCERWNKRVREAEGLHCVIYDWRHTFATRAAAAGMPLATLAKILGHNDLKTVLKYVHPGQDEQDREMEKLSIRVEEPRHDRRRTN